MGPNILIMAVVIAVGGFPQGHFCDLPTHSALIPPCLGPQGRSVQTTRLPSGTKIASLNCQKYRSFRPCLTTLGWCFVGVRFTQLWAAHPGNARSGCRRPKGVKNNVRTL